MLASCGGGDLYRPLSVEIEGLSARASELVLMVFPQETGQTCVGVDLAEGGVDLDAAVSVAPVGRSVRHCHGATVPVPC